MYIFVAVASIAKLRARMPEGKESQLQLATPVEASIRQILEPMAKKGLPLTGSTETPVVPWLTVPGPWGKPLAHAQLAVPVHVRM